MTETAQLNKSSTFQRGIKSRCKIFSDHPSPQQNCEVFWKGLDKEAFLSMANAFGLNINDPHIEELYAYVQKILPSLKRIEELDLTEMEPVMPPLSAKV